MCAKKLFRQVTSFNFEKYITELEVTSQGAIDVGKRRKNELQNQDKKINN